MVSYNDDPVKNFNVVSEDLNDVIKPSWSLIKGRGQQNTRIDSIDSICSVYLEAGTI